MATTTKTATAAKTATKKPVEKPEEPRGVGRPASEFDKRYQVRHNDEQMAQWEAKAAEEGRPLQDWIRRSLDKASRPRS